MPSPGPRKPRGEAGTQALRPGTSPLGTARPGTVRLGALSLGFAPAVPPDCAFGLVRDDQSGFESRLPHSQAGGLGARLCGLFFIYHTEGMAVQPCGKDMTSHLSSINVGGSPRQAGLRFPEKPFAPSFPQAPDRLEFSHRRAIFINFGSIPNLASMTTKCKA